MYDLQRVWDAWPGLRHTQTLRTILRECYGDESQKIINVFVVGSHLFVVTGAPEDAASSSTVYVFDVVPKSHQLSGAVEKGGATADKAAEEVGLSERQKVQLLSANSIVVDVICTGDSNNTVLVVEQSGLVHVMHFTLVEYTWTSTGHVELNPSKRLIINNILFDKDRRTFVWCQTDNKGQDGVSNCSIHLCEVEFTSNRAILSKGSQIVLNNAPLMNLYQLKGGICMLPRVCAPPGLSLFWTFNAKKLIPYIWCHGDRMLCHLVDKLTNFKTVVMRLSTLWKKGCNASQGLVAIQTRSPVGDLLALDNEMNIYSLILCRSHIERKHCFQLSDPIGRFQTLPLLHTQPITEQLQLISHHNNIGVLYKGCLRLYNGLCGELISSSDELEGSCVEVFRNSSAIEQFGVWTQHGVWIVRSKKIVDHAQLLAQGLFPVTSNADEMTMPGHQLPKGQSYAAQLCHAWGLHLQATKYVIGAIYSILKSTTEDGEFTSKEIPPELMKLLKDTSLQSPALLVALLVQFPECQGFLKKKVKEFTSLYYLRSTGDNGQREEKEDEAIINTDSLLFTSLNKHLAPLLAEYGRLADEYDALLLNDQSAQHKHLSIVDEEVKRILVKAETWVATRDGPITKLLSKLESLMMSHPTEVLQSIKEYIGVNDFQEACTDFSGSALCTAHNWKMLFAAESSSPGDLQCPSRIPLFEITCELLYLHQPEQLLGFVNFARVARDTQPHEDDSVFARKARKTFFYQRALDVLIPFASISTDTSHATVKDSHAAVKAYCQLLLLSERPDAEVSALDVLLNNELWTDAISLTKESCKEHNAGLHNLMFYKLLGHLLETGKLQQYYNSVWKICPRSFSGNLEGRSFKQQWGDGFLCMLKNLNIFDLLSILKHKLHNDKKSDETLLPPVMANDPSQMTVKLLLPQMYELLERAGLKR